MMGSAGGSQRHEIGTGGSGGGTGGNAGGGSRPETGEDCRGDTIGGCEGDAGEGTQQSDSSCTHSSIVGVKCSFSVLLGDCGSEKTPCKLVL